MIRRSRLDAFLERFQHRWETNPQYRAAMSGVLGVIFLVFICACVGLVSTGAQAALAGLGFASGNNNSADQGSTYTGAKAAHGVTSIPISTVTLGTPQPILNASLPPSGTPLPTPTLAPTPTDTPTPPPCTSNCGNGGGGGGGCPDCTVSAYGTPNPWLRGQPGYVHVHTSKPNVGINILVNYSNGCPSQLNGGSGSTNEKGDYDWPVQGGVVNPCASATASITIMAGFNNGADLRTITVSQPVA